jgi:hypothetical protein
MRGAAIILSRILWAVAFLGAGWGALEFGLTYVNEIAFRTNPDISAPQLAALAGSCLAWGVLPYVLARAFQEMTKPVEL